MAFEKKELTGYTFPERNKKSPKAPDETGWVLIEGVEYRASGWHRDKGTSWSFISRAEFDEKFGGRDRGRSGSNGSRDGGYGGRGNRGGGDEIPF